MERNGERRNCFSKIGSGEVEGWKLLSFRKKRGKKWERLVVSRIESRNLTSHRIVFYVLIDRIDSRIAKSSRNILPTRSHSLSRAMTRLHLVVDRVHGSVYIFRRSFWFPSLTKEIKKVAFKKNITKRNTCIFRSRSISKANNPRR